MVNGAASSLFQSMPGQSATWQREILRALQTWVAAANIDVDLVSDSGASIGTRGPTQGDSRFGDIRVAARPLSDNVLAITAPPGYLGGTRSGDIVINSNKVFSIGGSANSYDLYSCMLQECGHALGIDNSTDPASPMFETYSGVRTGLTAGDIADIQSLYGSRTNDAFDNGDGNQYSSTATALNLPLGIALNSSLVANASISTPGDVDYYKVHTQLLNFGGMTVRLNAGSSLLAPKVTVYGPSGNVVGSAQSLNPQTGELVISLSSVQSLATYTIRVEAANSAFAVGDYQLKVVFDPSALDFVFNAVGQLRDDLHTDDILAAAFRLNTTAGYTSQTHYSQTATIRDAYDVDVYVIRSAVVSGNQQSAMTINVRTLGQSTLDPMIVVYNAQQQQVAAKIIVNDDGTYTVQVNNTTSNSDYFVKIKSANAGGTGNYQLDVDFRTVCIDLQNYANDTLELADGCDHSHDDDFAESDDALRAGRDGQQRRQRPHDNHGFNWRGCGRAGIVGGTDDDSRRILWRRHLYRAISGDRPDRRQRHELSLRSRWHSRHRSHRTAHIERTIDRHDQFEHRNRDLGGVIRLAPFESMAGPSA